MDHFYSPILPLLQELRASGMTLAQTVEHLNALGHRTRPTKSRPTGSPWNQATLSRVLQRYAVCST
jgi:hypothetical protein